ncbi:hypothetical protein NliqN6_2403 [Naganishia liquefaciens]|uniref:Zn(2)-C6 fungal-type domain-containing protein n=1 Tax=Naganishia liquefaciens TaxID=104408 RepID=A0A8H3TS69_9TREE|nr:hypothetical protein NliqN6_2403 [Naganishia liquefaciens]
MDVAANAKEEPAEYDDDGEPGDPDDKTGGAEGSIKRPRLRLSQACDRCRRRKIRCDTQQPCGPCQATRNVCTFESPSKRMKKKKEDSDGKRAQKKASTNNLRLAAEGSALPILNTFEARLGSLEALLRDVPPDVHNALISRLDASLNVGPGESSSEASNVLRKVSSRTIAKMPERNAASGLEEIQRSLQGLNLSNGYLYLDEIGQTKWQGATSGFPLLDLLTAAAATNGNLEHDPVLGGIETGNQNKASNPYAEWPANPSTQAETPGSTASGDSPSSTNEPDAEGRKQEKFFPGRAPRPSQMLNPEATWRVITNVIPSDLMDTLVRCYLSTSHLLWPFLHVPSFLADYANPQKWAEPGFACFVVAVCTLSSRHVDDPRVRAKVDDPSTAGKQYFELFKRLRDLPSADRPTLYSIQAAFLAAIFAFGLGTLSKAFSLLAESVTLCLDGGLHRSVEGYEYFNPIEQETRKRTFWSIYSWDKQSAALFGRPPTIHLRDCDVPEPLQVDDEFITKDKILEQPASHQTRLSAFVAVIRLHVVLEGVVDSCVTPSSFASSPFLSRAASTISRRSAQANSLMEEEALLEEWVALLPKHWHYDVETVESKDPIRITQAERLHCLEHLVRMIVYRHRFSGFVQIPAATDEERARHLYYCKKAMDSALTICANHVHISQRGMMTYYGVHVIHQLAQAGRTLVAVILNCKTPEFAHLIAPATEGLRSCVGLLRRFSGRYLCGLRSADIIEEFCRICHIPVDTLRGNRHEARLSPAWLRPVQKRRSPSPAVHPQRVSLPRNRVSFLNQSMTNGPSSATQHSGVSRPAGPSDSATNNGHASRRANATQGNIIDSNDFQDLSKWLTDALDNPASANALLSTQEFFDLSAAASPNGIPTLNSHRASISSALGSDPSQLRNLQSTTPGMKASPADSMLYAGMAPGNQYDIQREPVHVQSTNNTGQTPSELKGDYKGDYVPMDTLGPASAAFDQFESLEPDATLLDSIAQGNGVLNDSNQWDVPFASGNDVLGQMSASTILQLMQQGTFTSSWT